jgi:ribonucleoside-diphosphate reductase alpha chain
MSDNMVDNLIKERYCIGTERSWEDICKRVSDYIGTTSKEKEEFYKMLMSKDFLPNSPTLMNSGTKTPMLSACFYLPISDCISNDKDGIFDQVRNAALIFKFGGGVGLNFSNLRPAGSKVRSTNGVSSGVISFMRNFNTMTETIKQGGKRRGALMGCLDITHPEAYEFIICKSIEGDLSNFNISVKLTDEFLSNPDQKTLNGIIDGIYKNGEPGILFKNTIEKYNPRPDLGELNPNPCAEALLYNFESCNLGSINWSNMILPNVSSSNWKDHIDWSKYEYTIRKAVHFLNNVIDKNQYPLPEIDKASKLTRKIGLGGMGLHDLLLKLNIPYESNLALEIGKELELFMKKIAKDESEKYNFKNTSLTTIAPTGTISIIAEVSSGIEPVFNWVITRKDSLGEHYVVHPIFDKKLEEELRKIQFNSFSLKVDGSQYWDILSTKNAIIEHCHKKGTIQDIDFLSKDFKNLFKNAMDINWKHHIKMQSTFQNNGVDMSISKTINLPNDATKEDIKNAIFMAWKLGCKGLTIYRSGSREHEVLNLKKEDLQKPIIDIEPKQDYKRPRCLFGATYKVQSGCGKLFVTINERNGKPYEVIIQSGGSGGCEAGNQALGRAISLALRTGGDIRNIIKQLCKVKCPAALRNPRSEGKSCSDIIGKLIEEYIPDADEDENETSIIIYEICPDCRKKTLFHEAGCKVCHACGYSKCG